MVHAWAISLVLSLSCSRPSKTFVIRASRLRIISSLTFDHLDIPSMRANMQNTKYYTTYLHRLHWYFFDTLFSVIKTITLKCIHNTRLQQWVMHVHSMLVSHGGVSLPHKISLAFLYFYPQPLFFELSVDLDPLIKLFFHLFNKLFSVAHSKRLCFWDIPREVNFYVKKMLWGLINLSMCMHV